MIRFDSEINNPYTDAINIINNIKIRPQAIKMVQNADENYFRNQYLTVLKERLINGKTLEEVGQMLSVTRTRIWQIEIRLKEILTEKMKSKYVK
jgi:DNA-directed RNA polymerase sigma subunit (sigma70/sigma32)